MSRRPGSICPSRIIYRQPLGLVNAARVPLRKCHDSKHHLTREWLVAMNTQTLSVEGTAYS
jgi:hypothetical protein